MTQSEPVPPIGTRISALAEARPRRRAELPVHRHHGEIPRRLGLVGRPWSFRRSFRRSCVATGSSTCRTAEWTCSPSGAAATSIPCLSRRDRERPVGAPGGAVLPRRRNPDPNSGDLGQVPYALVHRADGSTLNADGVKDFLREHISSYEVPHAVEFVDHPLRDDAGKARRSAVRAEVMARLRPPQRV